MGEWREEADIGECRVETDAVASKASTTLKKQKGRPEQEDWGMACWVGLVFLE